MIRYRNILAFFLLLLTAALWADDREMVRVYCGKARELLRLGEMTAAENLLVESLELVPDYSEALFLLGKIYCSRQETMFRGIPLLERAERTFTQNNFAETPKAAIREELANAYLQTRRYREAVVIFENIKKDHAFSAALEIARARAVYGAGNALRADAIFEEALKAFPEDKTVYLAYLRNLMQRGRTGPAARLVERGLNEFPSEPQFIYYKIAVSNNKQERKILFDFYQEKMGTTPGVALYYLTADLETFRRLVEFFHRQGGGTNALLIERIAGGLRSEKTRLDLFAKNLRFDEGEKYVDADEDGFYEEKYFFHNNEMEKIIFDRNQNGVAEVEIYFENGRVARISAPRNEEERALFIYNSYPRLAHVRFERKERITQYDLIPDALLFTPIKSLPALKDLKSRAALVAGVVYPTEDRVARLAFAQLEESPDGGTPLKKWELFDNKKLVLHEDADHDKIFEHTVIYNEKGIALRGFIDHDEDGFPETIEIYEGGRLTGVAYDEDGDGRSDYWESANRTQKRWDLNEDGVADVIEKRAPDGKPVWEYDGLLRRK